MKITFKYITLSLLAGASLLTSCEDFWTESRWIQLLRIHILRMKVNWQLMLSMHTVSMFIVDIMGADRIRQWH